jgi:hypothetical protein
MQARGTVTSPATPLTSTDLISACSSVLEGGGYEPIRNGFPKWNTTSTRLFEDKYNVVGLAVFVTAADLLSSWADLQGELVEVISRHVSQMENKAWDGYLVLLTSAIAPSSYADIEGIRSDTTRLRKLVATGEDLSTASDVERLLRPLLPLRTAHGTIGPGAALDLLPQLLAAHGIAESTTRVIVEAFIEQEPLMDALHRLRGPK